MSIATLSIDIEARFARLEAGVARANTLLGKLSAGADAASKRVGEIFTGVVGANLATEAITRIVNLFPQVVDGVLAIKDLAEATGSSVENISALDDIARRTGGDIKQVEGVLIKFNAALKDADAKNGAGQALQALGLSAAELRRLDPAEALLRTAQAMEQFADDGNRARLVQELFGKGVKDAGTFLRDLAEAGRLNATVTSAQAEQVDRFDKSMASLGASATEAGRAVALVIVPAINELFDAFKGAGPGYISQYLAVPLQAVAVLGANVAFVFKGIVVELAGIAAQATAVARLDFSGAAAIGRAMREDAAKARADFDALERRLLQMGSAPQADYSNEGREPPLSGGVAPKKRAPALADAARVKQATAAWEDYQQSLTRGLADLAGKTDTVKLAELNAQLQRLEELSSAGLDPKIVQQVREMLLKPEAGFVGPPISEELERVNGLLKQTDSARLAAAARDAALLRKAMTEETPGTQRWAEFVDALADAEANVERLRVAVPDMVAETDAAAKQMRQTIEGALGSTLSSALRGEFDSVGQLWRNLLIDMAARAVSADIMGALFGGQKAGGGGGATSSVIWGALLKLFGSANGNAFGPAGLIPFANGGVVTSATPFTFGGGRLGVMGESGPEAILPLKRGAGGKLGVVSSGGGGVHIVNQVTVHGGASRAEVMQAMAIAQQRAVASIQDAMRRGHLMPAAT